MLTPQELMAKVRAIESYLTVRQMGGHVQLVLASHDGKSAHQVRMPVRVWALFLLRQVGSLPGIDVKAAAEAMGIACNPFPHDPDYAGDADHLPIVPVTTLPPDDASHSETKPSAIPGDVAPGEQPPTP